MSRDGIENTGMMGNRIYENEDEDDELDMMERLWGLWEYIIVYVGM